MAKRTCRECGADLGPRDLFLCQLCQRIALRAAVTEQGSWFKELRLKIRRS